MTSYLYAIGIGSNRAGLGGRSPAKIVAAALEALDDGPLRLLDAGPAVISAPLGPSRRCYANCVALMASQALPDDVLAYLHAVEDDFGRKRRRVWGERTLDLDLILWSEGSFASNSTVVPHPEFRNRGFVLAPLARIAPDWHDPVTGLSVRQLLARFNRAKPVDRFGARP
ncbi:MAG: 2-amino-4-hydroxy-6-hydroxymethyldihydropteridine diphosphokinase [Sphingopyxis sp.]|nr:2-amino-4-hydroxy-6-hydroxymethyldihydropteridine diphosphokinase [Sphingopyxis sp.]